MKFLSTPLLFVLLGLLSLVLSCKKEESQPTPTTLSITTVTPMSGTVGTKVVITGTGFSPTLASNSIKFGTTIATVDSASTTRLVTKVPQGAQTAKISVEVGGKIVSSTNDFSISPTTSTTIANNTSFLNELNYHTFIELQITSAKIASVLNGANSGKVLKYGHVWSESNQSPTLNDNKSEFGPLTTTSNTYSYTSTLSGLKPNTIYYALPYITTATGTVYGPRFLAFQTNPSLASTSKTYRLNGFKQTAGSSSPASMKVSYNNEGRISTLDNSFAGNEASNIGKLSYTSGGDLVSYTTTSGLSSSSTKTIVTLDFKYDNKKLSSFIEKRFTSYNGSLTLNRETEYTITLNSSGQSEQWQFKTSSSTGTIGFRYDNTGNLFQAKIKASSTINHSFTFLEHEYLCYDNQPSALSEITTSEAMRIVLATFLPSYFNPYSKNNVKIMNDYSAYGDMVSIHYTYSNNNQMNSQPTKADVISSYRFGTLKATTIPFSFEYY